MALTKSQSVLGFTTNAYAKVSEIALNDYMDGDTKRYCLVVRVTLYTDSTKTYVYGQKSYDFQGQTDVSGTIANAYTLLKSDEYSDWADC